MLKRMRSWLILGLMSTQTYRWLLKNVIPYVRFTTYYTSLRGWQYHEGYWVLQPGHIILTTDKKKLTGLLIPGQMSHAALCINKRPQTDSDYPSYSFEIAEMTHTDYTRSDFFDLCKEADRVVIMQCQDWDHDYTRRVIEACLSFEGAKYDAEFDLGVQALYCSELIFQADRVADLDSEEFPSDDKKYGRLRVDLRDFAGLGRPYLSPDGLLFGKNLKCIWDSEGEWQGLMGEQIDTKVGGV